MGGGVIMGSFFKGSTLYREDENGDYLKVNDLIPVNHWKLQEASGTDVNDSGDNPLTLTNSNAVVDQTGKIDKAYSFNGTTAYLRVEAPLPNDSQGAFCARIKTATTEENTTIGCLTDTSEAGQLYGFQTRNTGFIGFVGLNSGFTTNALYGNTQINDDNWHFVVVQSTGSAYELYVDGVAETITIQAGNNDGRWFNSSSDFDTTLIGALERSGTQEGFFDGLIEDVRYYDRALTEQEIMAIYNEGEGTYSQSFVRSYPTRKPPVNHWKLQEEYGTDVNDSMDNSRLTNINATVNQAGKIGKCYDFDGSGQRLRTTAQPTGLIGSLSFLANIDSFDNRAIITSSDEASTNYYWSIRFVSGNIIQILTREGASSYTTEGTTSLSTGVWYHFVVVSLGDSYKVYINSTEETLTGDNDGKWFGDISNRDNFVIGAFQRTSVSGGFDGRVEDIRLYDYALSRQEIDNIYNSGRGLLL